MSKRQLTGQLPIKQEIMGRSKICRHDWEGERKADTGVLKRSLLEAVQFSIFTNELENGWLSKW